MGAPDRAGRVSRCLLTLHDELTRRSGVSIPKVWSSGSRLTTGVYRVGDFVHSCGEDALNPRKPQ
jgi:hypothetical protein